MTLWLRRWLVAVGLVLTALATPATAETVSSVKTSALPTPPGDGSAATLLMLDGRPVILQRSGGAILSSDGTRWTPLNARPLGRDLRIAGSATDGSRAVVLLGTPARIERAALIELSANALRGRLLPTFPVPLGRASAALQVDMLSVAATGVDGRARLLRLALTESAAGWQEITGWSGGAPLALAPQAGALYLTTDNGAQWRWTAKTGWQPRTAAPGRVVAGSARPIGQANLLYLLEAPGGTALYSYSGITDAWAALGHNAAPALATAPYVNGMASLRLQDGRLALASTQLEYQRRPLSIIDWSIVGVYLAGMLAIGFWFWRKSRMGSTSEFFLGSRSIPFWAAGVSMFATNTSSISYLAVPAKAFDTDWQYMMSKVVTVFALTAVAFWIIPMFRRLNLVSVFSYLETRFHPAIRMLSSALAILMHVGGRMGVVLFLPALAIGTITGTNVIFCILIIGICTIIYTALGGMKAVVWTDFFQVVVLFGGAFFAIGFIVNAVGAQQIYDTAMQFDKTKMLNVSFDFTTPTIWGFIILYTFDTVLTFPKDQVLMQRVLSTPSEKEASRSVWFFAAVLLPAGFVFYIIGTTLFAYYRANPGRLDPLLPVDAVFPAFIGTELPHGVTGIIIAGLFAAAMGTLSGTINSVATLLSVDFYERLKREKPTQKQSVRFAEWMTVLIGLIGIGLAIILSRLDVHSLLDLTIELFGLLGGSCAGAYTLGMFTTRANWQGTAIGIIGASMLTLVCWIFGLVHPYFYLAIAIVASIVIGYVASFLFPPPAPEQLKNMTVFTGGGRKRGEAAPSTSTS